MWFQRGSCTPQKSLAQKLMKYANSTRLALYWHTSPAQCGSVSICSIRLRIAKFQYPLRPFSSMTVMSIRISGHGMTQVYSNPCILPCVKSLESSSLVFLVRFSPASGSFQFHAMQPSRVAATTPRVQRSMFFCTIDCVQLSSHCNESCKDVENMESPLRYQCLSWLKRTKKRRSDIITI